MDYAVMLLVPAGAVVIARTTTFPGFGLGLYGILAAMVLLTGQLSDRNLIRYELRTSSDVNWFVAKWCAIIVGMWAISA